MSDRLHRLILLRHGETEWSATGRHTGRTEQDLTETGREQAVLARPALAELQLTEPLVISSPRRRALDTAELAGLHVDEIDPELSEWDYGDYEGLTTPEIRESVPDWLVWTHGCPGGESVDQVSARADRAVATALEHLATRDVVFVGHGHFSRAMLTRWAELPVSEGIRLSMVPASLAVCGFEHGVRQITALGLTGHPNPCLSQ
ncbi:acid phosphatase [Mycolicibacterium peregrinum]|uniref:Acid phosphatase n=1 Tax=Mycolicibacterium peregrinum TaxID=43304 RepID=A0A1X2AGH9_MYCPR|nr:acid phosphatase [Mycolicibacterium peregrinum]MCV7203931.1 acid phosphatase [Mycolicibacterium peregrinum]ORW50495.1 acid phosphatase [Mycolicibacterium peregrinum]OWM03916.1 acid phosphatase [Mycolicibacterium peregrinum]TGB39199.1 acid phosphatase [Mycolicibacterium peregrinum]TGB39735.1 acid phosphatase [Mycolicibacterium peregrinum]